MLSKSSNQCFGVLRNDSQVSSSHHKASGSCMRIFKKFQFWVDFRRKSYVKNSVIFDQKLSLESSDRLVWLSAWDIMFQHIEITPRYNISTIFSKTKWKSKIFVPPSPIPTFWTPLLYLHVFSRRHTATKRVKDALKLRPPNCAVWGACFSEYILKEWSYGNYFLHGSKTSLNGCSEEKIVFIGGLEKFLDDFEKKVRRSKWLKSEVSQIIKFWNLRNPRYFSTILKKCLSPALKSFWWVEWYCNCNQSIPLGLKNIKIITTCATNVQIVI